MAKKTTKKVTVEADDMAQAGSFSGGTYTGDTYTGTSAVVIPTPIAKLSVDYGREDLNNMAKKINELIDLFYEKRI